MNFGKTHEAQGSLPLLIRRSARFAPGQEEARGRCSGQPRAHVMLGIPGSIPWGLPRDKKGYLYHNRRRRGRYDRGSRSKLQF